jgi:hypothetical protein
MSSGSVVTTHRLAGILADLISITAAIWAVSALTAASGIIVAARMYETHRTTR